MINWYESQDKERTTITAKTNKFIKNLRKYFVGATKKRELS